MKKIEESSRPVSLRESRKSYFVNSAFQWPFVLFVVGLVLSCVAVFFIADLYFFWKFRDGGRALGLRPDHAYFTFLAEQESVRRGIFAIAAFVVSVIGGVSAVLFSHRIAGPLHRLKSHFLQVANELTVDDVRFRKDDFFQDVAYSFNQLMAKYRRNRVAQVLTETEEPKEKSESQAS